MPSVEKIPQTIDYRGVHIIHNFVYRLETQQVKVKFAVIE